MDTSLNFFEHAFNNSIIPTWIADKKGYLKNANQSFYNFFGISHKEIFQQFNFFLDLELPFYIYQEIHSGQAATFEAILDFKALKSKYDCSIENKVHIYINISPILFQEAIEGYLIHAIPVTEEYLKRLMNRRLLFFFDNTFKKLPIGIAAFSPDGKILETNQYMENIFDCSKKNLIESNFFDCCLFETAESAKELFEHLIIEKKDLINKKIHTHLKNGKELYLKINSAPIYDSENDLLYFFLMIEDITEWKMIESSKKIVRLKLRELKEHLENINHLLNLSQEEEKPGTGENFAFTKREQEIIELIGQGYANKEIAFKLKLSEATIKKNIFNIFKKTKTQNRLSLINFLKKNSYF